MKKTALPNPTRSGATHLVEIDHTDLTMATVDTAQLIPIATVPAGTIVEVVATRLRVPFKDASDAAFNTTALEIGDTGDPDRLLVSQELNVNGTEILGKAGVAGGYVSVGALTVNATFDSMDAKGLVNIDVGVLQIYLKEVELDKLAR